MKQFGVFAVAAMFSAGTIVALSATPAMAADSEASCASMAVSKDGKPLSGAAKNSSIKKCEADKKAAAAATCEPKAVGKDGKPLAGAAKSSFMKKCVTEASK